MDKKKIVGYESCQDYVYDTTQQLLLPQACPELVPAGQGRGSIVVTGQYIPEGQGPCAFRGRGPLMRTCLRGLKDQRKKKLPNKQR